MKKLIQYTAALLICFRVFAVDVFGRELVAVGQVVGLELQDGTVTVADFDDELGAAAEKAGLQVGDRIVSIDGKTVTTAEDVRRALDTSAGFVELCIVRDGKEQTLRVAPEITSDGPKLGLYLRQGVTGIGTVTWYDPETGKFGALGHGVNDSAGQLLQMKRGGAYCASVVSARKGLCGEPGQLMGTILSNTAIGTLEENLAQGVFGVSEKGWQGRILETASFDEIKPGPATILSTVSGNEVREYSVEILKLYPKAKQSGRNLLIKVTDPQLLEYTGGIVQGMSGSPILQDGRIVGAVTHVLVNDPTTGYGIFIENMLDAAS